MGSPSTNPRLRACSPNGWTPEGGAVSAAQIRRGFLDIAEGQIHFRAAGREPAQSEKPLLVMFHGAPGSSKQFERLVLAMASVRPVMALDTMGMGDSSPPARQDADMAYFADAAGRALESHGVTGKLDVLGHHEGAAIAAEFAIAWPARVGKLILDGMSAAPTEPGKCASMRERAGQARPRGSGRDAVFRCLAQPARCLPVPSRRPAPCR